MQGLVLAGGASSRFGRNKALFRWQGERLLERSARLMSGVCREIRVSGDRPDGYAGKLPWIPDAYPARGPIVGILTCLEALKAPLLALACDLLRMDRTTLEFMAHERMLRDSGHVMTTFIHLHTGYIEPLCAIYEPGAVPLLKAAVEEGEMRIFKAIPPERIHTIPVAETTPGVFFNCNTMDDLKQLSSLQ